MPGPVSTQDVQLLALLLASTLLTAIVFVMRSESAASGAIRFPPDAALAPPGRRTIATLLDAAPAVGVVLGVGVARGTPLAEAWDAASEDAVASLLLGMLVMFAHGVVGESLFGRTLGKALTAAA